MAHPKSHLLQRATEPVRRFLHVETAAGILLLGGTLLSLILVNSPLSERFEALLETEVGFRFGAFQLNESVHEWINEGLMTIFFFVVGLEIKRELVNGELSDKRKAALPVIAALCGMAAPALIYTVFNLDEAARGWAIPMATDIAFALGVVTLAGSRVPPAAKIFLLSLAVADDIGSIVIVALFYSSSLSIFWLAATLASIGAVVYLRANDIRSIPVYVVVGTVAWYCALKSGVPPTLVGVVLGLLAPARHHPADHHQLTITERIQNSLHPYSSFVILPLFAIANAGVAISGSALAEAATSPVTIGVVLARTLGKWIGIAGGVWLIVRLGIAPLPKATSWRHINGMAIAAGAGFTVCLFVTDLAFGVGPLADQAKVGILVGTVISAAVGLALLLKSKPLETSPETSGRANAESQPVSA